jgi:putative two-component system response regulator
MSPGELKDPGIEMALRLRYACEAHEHSISEHLERVSLYTCEIARLMGCSMKHLAELRYATPLHDLGKIYVPVAVLNKPGKLTTEEMVIVKTHTTLGHRMLEGSSWPVIRCAAEIALSHHECWDGSGYPYGIAGDRIPLDARIVAVADVYDALLSQRAYKPAWEESVVLNTMREMRGTKFDPEVLDVFLAHPPVFGAADALFSETAH